MTENQLIIDNTGLVIQIAKRFRPTSADELDEYIQVGRIGLLKAIRYHDPKRGKLTTIAWRCIFQEILRHVKCEQRQSRILVEDIYSNKSHITHNNIENIWEMLPDTLSSKEKMVLYLRLSGYTFKEINSLFNNKVKKYNHKKYNHIIDKIKEANEQI